MPPLQPYSSDLDYAYAPGLFPSMECLLHRPDCARRVLIHSKAAGREGAEKLTALAEQLHIRVEEADRALSRISAKENCFAAVVFSKFNDTLAADKPHIVLHHPGDHGNAGTILRTALGFGVEDIALIRPCIDIFDPHAVRATMGSLFQLRVHTYDDYAEYEAEFPRHYPYSFMLDSSRSLPDVLAGQIHEPFSLVFGNEGTGLPHEFALKGQPVRIPSNDRVDSLNLSIAAGIGIYTFMNR